MLVISDKSLSAWLSQLLIDRTLVAPVGGPNGLLLFQPVRKAGEVVTKFSNPTLSPKDWFFPRSEAIFQVVRAEGGATIVPATVEREAVVFGLRPCDARAISLIDKPFLAPPADTQYKEKRDKTALVGIACTRACAECFCTSMGSGPADTAGLDIMLTPIEGGYAVQAVTEKGKKLIGNAISQERDIKLPKPPDVNAVHTAGIAEAVRKVFNTNAYWDRLADRCLHCNACSYVCPTCYCFDIRDYEKHGKLERVRSWESCQSAQFIRAAGGHNPRPAKGPRLRQRFAHKLLFFPDIFGSVKCTGCGRCVKNCPVNIDIREVIADVQKLASGVK